MSGSTMIDRVAKALEQAFKDRVSASAGQPFDATGVIVPGAEVWQAYARAAVEAIDQLQIEQAGPYQWTKIWWDAESGMIRKTVINAEDVKL